MGLMDAQEYDPRPAQRRWRIIGAAVAVVLAVGTYLYVTRYDAEKKVVDNFFQAIEQKDFDTAYGIYQGDPGWKQHPEKYAAYTINQFKLDWGPQGEYGAINSHRIDCALAPPKKNFVGPSGVIVVAIINGRQEPRSMWVEKKSKSITDSPLKVACHAQQ